MQMFKKKTKLEFNDLELSEKADLFTMYRDNSLLLEKIVRIVLTDVIENRAKSKRDIEFAREILPLQNELIATFYKIIKEEQAKRRIDL